MRQAMMVSILLTIFLVIWLFPRKEEPVLVHHGAVDVPSFVIHLSGEVWFPGEYVFYDSITLSKIIDFAGGAKDEADLSEFNLFSSISRDRSIFIPKINQEDVVTQEKLNINKASFKDLILIPHMTESRAASLIIYRETHGHFTDLEDLIFVKYIGVATLEKIKPYLTIE